MKGVVMEIKERGWKKKTEEDNAPKEKANEGNVAFLCDRVVLVGVEYVHQHTLATHATDNKKSRGHVLVEPREIWRFWKLVGEQEFERDFRQENGEDDVDA